MAFVAAAIAPAAQAAGPYFARGAFYAGSNGIWATDAGNQLYDDGLHGDGAAGDSVFACTVLSDQPPGDYPFKIANGDWTENWPTSSQYPTENAHLLTVGSGESIHFVLDLRARAGWEPLAGAVACDHGWATGTALEIMGSAPEMGAWASPLATVDDGGVWTTVITIATPGDYEFKFRQAGNWNWAFGPQYNMGVGGNFHLTTTIPGTSVRLLYDTHDGRAYAHEFDVTPARPASWGRVKSLFR